MPTNQEIAQIFYEIADYLAMEDDPFRPQAYNRAARAIELHSRSLAKIYQQEGLKGLEKIPGVGKEIAKKVEEILTTGKLRYLEKLRRISPVDIANLRRIEGLGPKKIKLLYQELGITNLRELKQAARSGKIQQLEGFRQKSEENILKGIQALKTKKGRVALNKILPIAEKIKEELKSVPEAKKVVIAGSIRRREPTIGDIDILVLSDKPTKVMDFFEKLPEIAEIYGRGETKLSARLKDGIDIDLRVIKKSSFGAALQYFTGNKAHNIKLRQIARRRGYKLNEYGLFKGKRRIAGRTEEEIYRRLGVLMPPPEKRLGEEEIHSISHQVIKEKSIGAVIFHRTRDEIEYLMLHYPKRKGGSLHGHWGFVKGHVDGQESEKETLQREIREETGLTPLHYQLINGFKEIIHYYFKTGKELHSKKVVFYLIESTTQKVKLSFEHNDYQWLRYEEALKKLTFQGSKQVLTKAEKFLKEGRSREIRDD